jgi:hypothetical protein
MSSESRESKGSLAFCTDMRRTLLPAIRVSSTQSGYFVRSNVLDKAVGSLQEGGI